MIDEHTPPPKIILLGFALIALGLTVITLAALFLKK